MVARLATFNKQRSLKCPRIERVIFLLADLLVPGGRSHYRQITWRFTFCLIDLLGVLLGGQIIGPGAEPITGCFPRDRPIVRLANWGQNRLRADCLVIDSLFLYRPGGRIGSRQIASRSNVCLFTVVGTEPVPGKLPADRPFVCSP